MTYNPEPWAEIHAPQKFHRTDPTPHIPISEGEYRADWGALKWWLCLMSGLIVAWVVWRLV